MNHVFLSGTINAAPKMISNENEIPHAIMDLTVTHKSAKGVEKNEQYPISAWRGIATKMVEMIKPGCFVSIKGYLSQKQTNEGVFLEITVEEFNVATGIYRIRPLQDFSSLPKERQLHNNPIQPQKDAKDVSCVPEVCIESQIY